MKFLKILLWTVLILLGIYLILCATGSKDMNTSRSTTINASPANIYAQVADFNNWLTWSPWKELDSNMTNTVTGNPGEVGHMNEWKSEELGNGKQWIAEIRPNELVRNGLSFEDWPDTSYAAMIFEPAGDSTKVTWTMEGGEVPFFFRGIMTLMGGKGSMEETYDKGLANLKTIAEAMPKTEMVAFEVIDIPDTWYVGKMFNGVEVTKIDSAMYSASYKEIGQYMGSLKAAQAGAPLSIAHKFDEATMVMDLEIAIPVASQLPASGNITSGMIPAGKAARYEYRGNYDKVAETWGKFVASVMASHEIRWSSYEVYITDPGTEPDPSKWITHLIIPIKE